MSDTKEPSDIMTVQEVSKYLKIALKTAYTLVSQGDIPSFRIGKAVRVRREDLENYIRSNI